MTRWRCSSGTVVVVAALWAATTPALAASTGSVGSMASTAAPGAKVAPAAPSGDDSYADPSRDLGATSPSCRYALGPQDRRACRASGSIAEPHPLSSYGIDVRVGFSVTDPGKSFMGALQSLGAGIWMALLYGVKGVLLLLEWAFSLDLTNEAMPQVRRTLNQLHQQAFGDWWLLLAISTAGLWGIWRGLVQRRTSETLTGLAATVGLMVGCLVLISNPDDTVGRAAQATNDAGMAVLAAGTGKPASNPRAALAAGMRQVFESAVRDPWCALEFGSVEFCDVRTGDSVRPTNAELWLAYPAQGWERGRLQKLMKKDDGGIHIDPLASIKGVLNIGGDRKLPDDIEGLVKKAPERASIQEAGGTFPRLGLLVIVLIGLSGAIALYGYLGVKLILAAALSLVLLLIAPPMLLAPALGDSGRATFLAWIKRLLGAIAAKLVFAVFLTVVLAASRVFTSLDVGWFGNWILLSAFWWGIFIKRHEIIGFVAGGTPQQHGNGLGQLLSHGYYAWMLGRGVRQAASRGARPVDALRQRREDHQAARTAASSSLAREELDGHHREELVAGQQQARDVVTQRDGLRHELRATDRRLAGFDEATVVANATRSKKPAPNAEQRQLLEHRRQLRELLADPAASEAEQTVRHADRNVALTGDSVTSKDLDVRRARRAGDLRVTEAESTLSPEQVRERDLLAAAQNELGAAEAASRWLDSDELRQRQRQKLAEMRAERRRRRAGTGRRR